MEVRLTTFMEFVAANWGAKITCIKNAKNTYGEDYNPAKDFWKGAREGIIDMHQAGYTTRFLDDLIENLADAKKVANYTAALTGYTKWARGKRIAWVGGPSVPWVSGDLTVKVHPELSVILNGQPYAIKLWLKKDQLTKKRVDATLHLMELTHGLDGTNVGILDARRSNLIVPTRLIPGIDALLAGEAAAFVEMWRSL